LAAFNAVCGICPSLCCWERWLASVSRRMLRPSLASLLHWPVAMAVFQMPARLALTAAAYGAGYGIFPICWIILPVIFLYQTHGKDGQV